ncbi:MAG: hypothetical protein MI757_13840 [Pirellulales bacterium]|nr:hypothetical protein [Pirellulales bacterium]
MLVRLRNAIAVDFPSDVGLMRITVRARDAEEAAFLANSIKHSYLSNVVETMKQARLASFARLETKYEAYSARVAKAKAKLTEFERAFYGDDDLAVNAASERMNSTLEFVRQKAAALSLKSSQIRLEVEWLKQHLRESGTKPADSQREKLAKLEEQSKAIDSERLFYIKQFEKRVAAGGRVKETSADLEARRAKVEFLSAAVQQMRLELQVRELNMSASPRIEDFADAER